MKTKIISLLLILCLVISVMAINVSAAEDYEYSITASTTTPTAGSEFDITFSLVNYAECEFGLRGIQVDFENIDLNVFEIVSHSELIDEATSAMNTTTIQDEGTSVRYVYASVFVPSLARSNSDIMTFKLKVRDDITQSGEISIPVTIALGYSDSDNVRHDLTYNDTLTINYIAESTEEPSDSEYPRTEQGNVNAIYVADDPSDVYSVDVTWGAMEFDYYPGGQVWNFSLHQWESDSEDPAKWTVNNESNKITLANHSSTEVNASLSFKANTQYTELSGAFMYDGAELTEALALELPAENKAAKEYVVTFMPEGSIPEDHGTEYAKVGSLTVTLV